MDTERIEALEQVGAGRPDVLVDTKILLFFHFRFAMMEEKIILSTILRNFDVFSVTKPKEISLLAELVLRPKNGLHVQFSKRHNRE